MHWLGRDRLRGRCCCIPNAVRELHARWGSGTGCFRKLCCGLGLASSGNFGHLDLKALSPDNLRIVCWLGSTGNSQFGTEGRPWITAELWWAGTFEIPLILVYLASWAGSIGCLAPGGGVCIEAFHLLKAVWSNLKIGSFKKHAHLAEGLQPDLGWAACSASKTKRFCPVSYFLPLWAFWLQTLTCYHYYHFLSVTFPNGLPTSDVVHFGSVPCVPLGFWDNYLYVACKYPSFSASGP